MCNTCNTSYFSGGCYSQQKMCRDCCGNVWIRLPHCGCGHNSCCGGGAIGGGIGGGIVGGTVGGTSSTGNFQCVTFCGNDNGLIGTNALSSNGYADEYYARQYGLYGYSGRCGCCSTSTTTTTGN